MKALHTVLLKLRSSGLRRIFHPLERLARWVIRRQSRIAFGPLRGLHFPHGDRGTRLGIYELEVQQVVSKYLKKGAIFYDIGAHRGYFTLLAAHLVGPQGHVYAFEPLPENGVMLEEAMVLNSIQNFTLTRAAISEKKGRMKLYLGDGNSYRPSLIPWKTERFIEVDSLKLDDFLQRHPSPSVIKIDVEGAEGEVLAGATSLLENQQSPPVWLIEIHSEEQDEAVAQRLHRYGFQTRHFAIPDEKPYPRHLLGWK